MPTRPRPLSFEMRPAPELAALLTLRQSGRARSKPFAPAFYRAVDHEVRRVTESLAMIETCLDWLIELGLARPRRDRASEKQQEKSRRNQPSYATNVDIALDLAKLAARVAREGGDPRGPWHAAAFAARTLLDAARDGRLITPQGIRVGARAVDARAAAAVLEQILREAGGRERAGEGAKDRAKTAAEPRAKPAVKAASKREPERATKPAAKSEPKRAAKTSPGAKAEPRRARTSARGFGGLPDDAQPEPRDVHGAPLGPRGITLDAEFFLEQAEIRQWPCAAEDLERGRKRALARLHPDRMGESATALFQRATRGHSELARRLAALAAAGSAPSNVATAATKPTPTPTAEKSAPAPRATTATNSAPPVRSPVGEWPPRASARAM